MTSSAETMSGTLELSWRKVVCKNVQPTDGHSACAVGDKLYIFGGVIHKENEYFEANQLTVFCPGSNTCKTVLSRGDVPSCRSSSAMASVGNKLYLFGGLSCESGWFNDMNVFDTDANEWKKLETSGTRPSPRDKVASAVVGDRIYFFGGFGPLSDAQVQSALDNNDSDEDDDDDDEDDQSAKFGWSNELFAFDTTTNDWQQLVTPDQEGPTPRAASSMCAISSLLIIFGGRDQQGRCNDLHFFDSESAKWLTDVCVAGPCPEARSFHGSVAVGNKMLVVGGRSQSEGHFNDVYILDRDDWLWSRPKVVQGFPKRGCHSLTAVADAVVMFGGSGNFDEKASQCRTFFDDFYVLPTGQFLEN